MDRLVQCFRALSEEMRLRIIMLLTHGELCVCDIMDVLGEPQSKVSRHLSYLKNSGLIAGKRVGVWMHYMLSKPADETLEAQIKFMKRHLSGLPDFREDVEKLEILKARKRCEGSRPRPGRPKCGAVPTNKDGRQTAHARRK